jgi:diacylglycerol O-acyltransferase
MHVAGLQLYTPPPGAGADFAQQLMESFRKYTAAREPFNLRPEFRLGHWFWEEDEDFEIEYHLRHSALPRPGRIRELLSLVSRLHAVPIDRSRPLWEAHLIEGLSDGRIAVYAKVHHAMFDGMAAMRVMQNWLSDRPDEEKAPLWALDPKKRDPQAGGANKIFKSIVDGLRTGAKEMMPGLRSGLWEVIRSGQTNPADATPYQAPPSLFNVPISGSRRFSAQSYSLERMRRIGKAAGATVNDVTLAVCAGALRQYLVDHNALPSKPLIALVPVSVRASGEDGGNQIAALFANLATHIADPAERLDLIMSSTKQAKDRLSKMTRLEQISHTAAMTSPVALSMLTGHAKKRPMFNVIISNVPGPKKTLYMNGMRLEEMYPVSIPVDYMALNITLSGYLDQLGFGYIACRRSVPQMQRLLDHTSDSLATLERAFKI